jgi:hypothetical protein
MDSFVVQAQAPHEGDLARVPAGLPINEHCTEQPEAADSVRWQRSVSGL